ncbi:hypothetical protein OHC33_002869 [Knufia fluminis]|uniref:Uncharacterized protein n=1 Tax=Knufia fluminis TaxID=191047 RepID=A0AAN8F467_9EURO|nr:hypothetical protein OHC33_002869 [Knufia fluminis]
MKLLQLILPALLSHATSTTAKAAPIPRQLSHPSDPYLNSISLDARQAPSVSGPSTLSTATATSDDTDLSTETEIDASPSTSTTTITFPSSTPTGPRNHNIAVAQNSTNFTPTTLKNIPIGDTLTFYFYPSNYSIIQSSFSSPCVPIKRSGGVDQRAIFSGFHPTSNGQIAPQKFVVTVKSTETTWIYALDGMQLATDGGESVCERGMVMVINPLPKEEESGETLRAYRNAAKGLDGNVVDVHECPGEVWGGEIIPLSEKQRGNWMAKHPLGGNPKNTTASGGGSGSGGSGNGTSGGGVLSYQNGAETVYGRGNSLMAVAVLVGACVFGVGM